PRCRGALPRGEDDRTQGGSATLPRTRGHGGAFERALGPDASGPAASWGRGKAGGRSRGPGSGGCLGGRVAADPVRVRSAGDRAPVDPAANDAADHLLG